MKKCPKCRGSFVEEFLVCVNCALCFRCAHPEYALPITPDFEPAKCSCAHQVVPYASKEWRARFRKSNPGAVLVGRLDGAVMIAKFQNVAHLVKLVGGTPEHPTCIKLQ